MDSKYGVGSIERTVLTLWIASPAPFFEKSGAGSQVDLSIVNFMSAVIGECAQLPIPRP